MATKSMSYDHAAYLAVMRQNLTDVTGKLLTGNATLSVKYAAFTQLLIKSVTITISPATATASASDQWLMYRITNNGTTAVNTVTATYTFNGIGSGAYFSNITMVSATAVSTSAATSNTLVIGTSPTVNQYDTWWFAKGADTAGTYCADVELAILPLANVTV